MFLENLLKEDVTLVMLLGIADKAFTLEDINYF